MRFYKIYKEGQFYLVSNTNIKERSMKQAFKAAVNKIIDLDKKDILILTTNQERAVLGYFKNTKEISKYNQSKDIFISYQRALKVLSNKVWVSPGSKDIKSVYLRRSEVKDDYKGGVFKKEGNWYSLNSNQRYDTAHKAGVMFVANDMHYDFLMLLLSLYEANIEFEITSSSQIEITGIYPKISINFFSKLGLYLGRYYKDQDYSFKYFKSTQEIVEFLESKFNYV